MTKATALFSSENEEESEHLKAPRAPVIYKCIIKPYPVQNPNLRPSSQAETLSRHCQTTSGSRRRVNKDLLPTASTKGRSAITPLTGRTSSC